MGVNSYTNRFLCKNESSSTSKQYVVYASGKRSGDLRISVCSPDPLMLSIAIKISLCWHYFMNFLYHVYIEIKYYSLKKDKI